MKILPDKLKWKLANNESNRRKIRPLCQIICFGLILIGCQTTIPEASFEPTTISSDPTRPVVIFETPSATVTVDNTATPVMPSASPIIASPTTMPPTPSPTIMPTLTPFTVNGFLLYGIVVDEESQIYALQPGGTSRFISTGQMLSGRPLSPDGTMLIIDTNDWSQPPLSPDKVFILNLETGETLSLNLLAHPRSGVFWSADGNSLLYIDKYSDNATDQLVLYDIVSGENQILVEIEHIFLTAGWSMDEEEIALVAEVDGQYDVFLINSNTLERRQLTNTDDIETMIRWSPTTSQLLVGITPDNGHIFEMWPWGVESLYRVDIVRDDWQLLTDTFLTSESVSWSPDGTQIVFTDAGLLCIMNLETMIETCPLAEVPPYNEYFVFFTEPPIWSEDMNWVAFRAHNGRCGVIYFLELETNRIVPGDLGCDISMVVPLSRLYWSSANWDMFSEQFP